MADADTRAEEEVRGDQPRPPIIDVHAHYVPPAILRELERDGEAGSLPVARLGTKQKLVCSMMDLDARADWMREHGIGLQLLGPEMRFARYDLNALDGASWSRRFNELMRESSDQYGVYAVVATVPMQDG